MDTEKAIRMYGKNYRTALEDGGFTDIGQKMAAFESRLRGMYASENYKKHNVYPTTDTTYIYAVIAMCLEIKALGYSDREMYTGLVESDCLSCCVSNGCTPGNSILCLY